MEIVGVNNFQKFSFSKTANEMLGYFENRPITVLEKCLLLSETTTTATEKYLNLQQSRLLAVIVYIRHPVLVWLNKRDVNGAFSSENNSPN